MKLAHVLTSIVLLAGMSLAQQPSSEQPSTPGNPDRTPRATDQTYTRQIETTGHNWGGWGLLGLLGLGGLLGRRRETTGATYTRDERTYGQQRRVG
jgi:MYXO-CTERM domain-containing protein